jgi:hypothetical protein
VPPPTPNCELWATDGCRTPALVTLVQVTPIKYPVTAAGTTPETDNVIVLNEPAIVVEVAVGAVVVVAPSRVVVVAPNTVVVVAPAMVVDETVPGNVNSTVTVKACGAAKAGELTVLPVVAWNVGRPLTKTRPRTCELSNVPSAAASTWHCVAAVVAVAGTRVRGRTAVDGAMPRRTVWI